MTTTSIVNYMSQDGVQENIRKTLGDKTPQFIATVASLVNSNQKLQECDQKSILSACLIAATLDLPVNQNLGFAYIIPYKGQAQFQLGYKGFIQLAQRSGQFKTINVTDVREGELIGEDKLTGEYHFDFLPEEARGGLETIGYAGYMELLSGFRKTLYMTVKELESHAGKYSQSYKFKDSTKNMWRDEFDAMARKTVIKLLLSRYAPMSAQMQTAQQVDQSVIQDENIFEYIDNPEQHFPEPDLEEVQINADEIKSVKEKIKNEANN